MNPGVRLGPTPAPPISPADLLALDIIGWAIDSPLAQAGPEAAQLLAPSHEEFASSLTPTLSWQGGGNAEHVYVAIFRRSAGVNLERVLFVEDPSGSSVTVPEAVLTPASEYSWNVVTENYLGFAYSTPRVFYTITPCPADFDESGTVTVADIFAFLTAWFAADLRADIDQSGVLEVLDIFAFLTIWFSSTC
jgi:hypothetical protein